MCIKYIERCNQVIFNSSPTGVGPVFSNKGLGVGAIANNAFLKFYWYTWKFVGTCKPTSMSFVPTKYLKYQQNIERNSSLECKNAKIHRFYPC